MKIITFLMEDYIKAKKMFPNLKQIFFSNTTDIATLVSKRLLNMLMKVTLFSKREKELIDLHRARDKKHIHYSSSSSLLPYCIYVRNIVLATQYASKYFHLSNN
jgi:hypothetical protein